MKLDQDDPYRTMKALLKKEFFSDSRRAIWSLCFSVSKVTHDYIVEHFKQPRIAPALFDGLDVPIEIDENINDFEIELRTKPRVGSIK